MRNDRHEGSGSATPCAKTTVAELRCRSGAGLDRVGHPSWPRHSIPALLTVHLSLDERDLGYRQKNNHALLSVERTKRKIMHGPRTTNPQERSNPGRRGWLTPGTCYLVNSGAEFPLSLRLHGSWAMEKLREPRAYVMASRLGEMM